MLLGLLDIRATVSLHVFGAWSLPIEGLLLLYNIETTDPSYSEICPVLPFLIFSTIDPSISTCVEYMPRPQLISIYSTIPSSCIPDK